MQNFARSAPSVEVSQISSSDTDRMQGAQPILQQKLAAFKFCRQSAIFFFCPNFVRKSEKQKMEMEKENKYDTTRTKFFRTSEVRKMKFNGLRARPPQRKDGNASSPKDHKMKVKSDKPM